MIHYLSVTEVAKACNLSKAWVLKLVHRGVAGPEGTAWVWDDGRILLHPSAIEAINNRPDARGGGPSRAQALDHLRHTVALIENDYPECAERACCLRVLRDQLRSMEEEPPAEMFSPSQKPRA
jgi:hypothetical protein